MGIIFEIIIIMLLWEISHNIKALNNNLIEIMKWLDKIGE